MRTPFYIALPEASSLAEGKEITFAQLHQRTWLLFERHVHPQCYDSILRAAAKEDVQPRLVRHVLTAEEAAQELYAGHREVAFLTRAGAWRIARNGITMRRHSELTISAKLIARAADLFQTGQ